MNPVLDVGRVYLMGSARKEYDHRGFATVRAAEVRYFSFCECTTNSNFPTDSGTFRNSGTYFGVKKKVKGTVCRVFYQQHVSGGFQPTTWLDISAFCIRGTPCTCLWLYSVPVNLKLDSTPLQTTFMGHDTH